LGKVTGRPKRGRLIHMLRSMKKTGAWLAVGYAVVTLAVASPLVREGYIGHGNGIVFLLATALTSPLSAVLFVLNDLLSDVNAFHMTGWPYFITLCELGAGALLNGYLIYRVVGVVERRWGRG
jgi:hypothetical protein